MGERQRDRETQGFRETEIHAQAMCVRRQTFMPSVRGECAATDCGSRAAARDDAFMHVLVIANVIKMPFNRMRHVVVLDQAIDDRGREASDCGSRAGARNRDSNDFCVERVSTHELIAPCTHGASRMSSARRRSPGVTTGAQSLVGSARRNPHRGRCVRVL